MNAAQTESDFIARTKQAREQSGLTQNEMAEILRIAQGTYKNYEINRTLPHRYIKVFCLTCRIDSGFLYGMEPVRAPRRRRAKAA